MEGWIKIHRQITKWQWYQDANTMRLFFHCLISAAIVPVKWKNIIIERGQFVCTIKSLSEQLGISPMQVRVSVKKLQSSQNITIKITNKFSIITICNFDTYQLLEDEQQQTNYQTNNKQITNKAEKVSPIPPLKEYKEKINKNIFSDENIQKVSNAAFSEQIDYKFIADSWNSICGQIFPKIQLLTEARKQKLKVRVNEIQKNYGDYKSVFVEIFQRMTQSPFFREKWQPKFDWVIENPNNYIKVLEGNYDNKQNDLSSGKNRGNEQPCSRREQRIRDERANMAELARIIEERSNSSYDGSL